MGLHLETTLETQNLIGCISKIGLPFLARLGNRQVSNKSLSIFHNQLIYDTLPNMGLLFCIKRNQVRVAKQTKKC